MEILMASALAPSTGNATRSAAAATTRSKVIFVKSFQPTCLITPNMPHARALEHIGLTLKAARHL